MKTLMNTIDKKNICDMIISEAKKIGFSDVIVYCEDSQTTTTSTNKQNLDDVSYENNIGVAVRLFKDNRTINFNSADLEENNLKKIIKESHDAISYIPEDEHCKVNPNIEEIEKIKNIEKDLNIYDENIHNLSIEERVNLLCNAEKNALGFSNLLKVDVCRLIDCFQNNMLVTSKGFFGTYSETDFHFTFSTITSHDNIGTEYWVGDSSRFGKI